MSNFIKVYGRCYLCKGQITEEDVMTLTDEGLYFICSYCYKVQNEDMLIGDGYEES